MIWVIALISILFGGVGQFLLKLGAQQLPHSGSLIQSVIAIFLIPKILIGLVLFGTSFIMWVFVLTKLDLSVAYPLVALSYITVTALSVIFLHEPMTATKLIGLLLVMVGVVVINYKAA